MSHKIKKIVILGGGTAGWITAGIIASEHVVKGKLDSLEISLVESTDIAPIGVGEGTWPSMRETLKNIGIDEAEFLIHCDASFKQASKFVGWTQNNNEHYYHPFTLPEQFYECNLAKHWLAVKDKVTFTNAVTYQGALCDHGLAPKQISTPAYSVIANYGYHLDAGKFGPFLRTHCIDKLGVKHIDDKVVNVNLHPNQDIKSVTTQMHGDIEGDFFIDCTGLHGLLLDKTYNIPFVSQKHILFNDAALAVQVPYSDDNDAIESATISTAQTNGWIWDIGLQSRRGVGHVYSTSHCTDDVAERDLRKYITPLIGAKAANNAPIRKLSINPGHREKFWHNNAVAVGMSAGFIEPLEASAIALIEQSAKYIAAQLPANRDAMKVVEKRFNAKFLDRWQQILDFLKLHYVLSKRNDSEYWQDNTDSSTIPESLKEKLLLWQSQTPYTYDSTSTEELFPSASYQYVYYGMGGHTEISLTNKFMLEQNKAQSLFQNNHKKTNQLLNVLNSNRELLNKIKQFGLQKI